MWPTWDEDDQGEPTLVSLQFFDGATKKSGENWIDIPGWNNTSSITQLWEAEKTFDEGKPFFIAPRNSTYKVFGNIDSRVAATVISAEFFDTNADRWTRKPLATRPKEWRYPGNRWLTGGTYMIADPNTGADVVKSDYSQWNIRAELTTSPDQESVALIDPDAFHDGFNRRLKLKWIEDEDQIRPLIYYGHFPGRRLGLKVTDQSKSFAHYVNDALAYGYDWIDSIYYCPFDTSDSEKFKITQSPLFEGDEIQGKFISPGKWEVFLMPRRWLYRFRYRHQVNVWDDSITTDFPAIPCACDNHLAFWFSGGSNELLKCEYTESPTCPSSSSGQASMKAWYADVTHYECFFWARWPCNWSAIWAGEKLQQSTARLVLYDSAHSEAGSVSFVCGETADEAKAHFLSAGGTADEADVVHTGALSSNLHICTDTSDYFVKVGTSDYGYSPIYAVATTAYGGPPVSMADYAESVIGFQPVPDEPEWGTRYLWPVIESSVFWTNTIKPLRDAAIAGTDNISEASRVDMIPWGVAVSPSKAGDLVGIVRKGGRAYFIWCRTDEELKQWGVGTVRNPIRWESNNADGRLGACYEGDYASENFYDADFADLWLGDETRKLTHIGRDIVIEPGEADSLCPTLTKQFGTGETEGEVTLHAPCYIMYSDERAMSDVEWSGMLEGANVGLRGRVGRVNAFATLTAQERNSY